MLGFSIHPRRCAGRLASYQAAVLCIALFTIICSRVMPPSCGAATSSIAAHPKTSHEQRPCFDQQDAKYTIATATLLHPPPAIRLYQMPHFENSFEFLTSGPFLDRSPPLT